MVQQGHESIIEHVSVNFELSNISRACATQILRHRLASYTCESMRYVKLVSDTDHLEVVTPIAIEGNADALKIFDKAVLASEKAYKALLDMGIKAEDARACLPIATCTRMFFTYNLREIRHFLKERLSPRAQREIRLVALQMYEYMYDMYPWLVQDLHDLYEKGLAKSNKEIPVDPNTGTTGK